MSLIVKIEGLSCCDGTLRLGLYSDKSLWMKDSGMLRGRISMVTSDSQIVEIHGIPVGQYAVAVHQDANGDGKLNRWFGLLPKEPYGFSNNVGKYGPAGFDAARFRMETDETIVIKMHGVDR